MRGSGGEEEEPSLNRLGTFLQACEQRLAEARRCQAAQDAAKAEAAKEAEEREARERAAEQAARALAAADAKALEEAKKRSQQAYLGYLSAVSRLYLGCLSAVSRLYLGCISAVSPPGRPAGRVLRGQLEAAEGGCGCRGRSAGDSWGGEAASIRGGAGAGKLEHTRREREDGGSGGGREGRRFDPREAGCLRRRPLAGRRPLSGGRGGQGDRCGW